MIKREWNKMPGMVDEGFQTVDLLLPYFQITPSTSNEGNLTWRIHIKISNDHLMFQPYTFKDDRLEGACLSEAQEFCEKNFLIDVHHLDDIIAMVEDSILNPLRNTSESSQESSRKSLERYKKIREELNANSG